MSDYWVRRGAKVNGPMSGAELKASIASGQILRTDEVSPDQQRWRIAGTIRELFAGEQEMPVDPPLQTETHGPAKSDAKLIAIIVGTGLVALVVSLYFVLRTPSKPVEIATATSSPASQTPLPKKAGGDPLPGKSNVPAAVGKPAVGNPVPTDSIPVVTMKVLARNSDVEVSLGDVFWTGLTISGEGGNVLRSETPTDSICLELWCSLLSDKVIEITPPEISANGSAIRHKAFFLISVGGAMLAAPVAETPNPLTPKHRKSGIFLVLKRSELQLKNSEATLHITNLLNLPAVDVTVAIPANSPQATPAVDKADGTNPASTLSAAEAVADSEASKHVGKNATIRTRVLAVCRFPNGDIALHNKRAGLLGVVDSTTAAPDKSDLEPADSFLIVVPLAALPQLKFKGADALRSALLGKTVLVSGPVSEFTPDNPAPGVFRVSPIPNVRMDKDAKLELLPEKSGASPTVGKADATKPAALTLPNAGDDERTRMKKEAERAFADGKDYFIWPAEKGPFKTEKGGKILLVPFNYFGKENAPKYRTAFSLVYNGNLQETLFAGPPDDKSKQRKQEGRDTFVFLDFFGREYRGKGTATLYLAAEGKDDPISNKITVEIEFVR